MVKADPDPVERVRWTSTRRADGEDDDLDTKLRGGVRTFSIFHSNPLLHLSISISKPTGARYMHQ